MAEVLTPSAVQPPVEVYWMSGCSACLRMKEFVESSGVDFVAIDAAAEPQAKARLAALGALVPCTVVGDQFAPGVNLAAVAKLIGVPYERPPIQPAAELVARYRTVNATLRRLIGQADTTALSLKLPPRDRTLLSLGYHAGSVIRLFLQIYDPDVFGGDNYILHAEAAPPADVTTAAQVIARAEDSLRHFEAWWTRDGHDDPLDRIENSGYWGHRTLLEVLEREVWHTAQHTRQVALFLETAGITPDRPLGAAELAGLPLPNRVFD
jgi:glutaredoxin